MKPTTSSIALLILVIVQCTLASPVPQFLTFRDGKFGVNFGGYHAEAGLGGLLTGNSAHGGLSASAGTPHGQQAGAGIGGLLGGNERTAGGAYAGATAGHGVGASAAIGGGLDGAGGAGGAGAESHAGGVSKKVVRLGQTNQGAPPTEVVISKETGAHHQGNFERIDDHHVKEVHTELRAPAPQPAPEHSFRKTIYKKKVISHPHKVVVHETHHTGGPPPLDLTRFFDFQSFTNLGAQFAHPAPLPPPPPPPPAAPIVQKTFVKEVSYQPIQTPTYHKEIHTRIDSSNGHSGGHSGASSSTHVVASSTHNSNFWNDIFNIPISTLTAVNQLLNNKAGSGSLHVEKRIEHH